MVARQHTLAKKLLCSVLCLSLAFGLSCPHISAYGDEDNNASPDCPTQQKSNNMATDNNISSQFEINQQESDDDNPVIGNDEPSGETTDPAEPIEPDPEPPVPVTGPITFDFNISSSPEIDTIEQVTSGLMVTWTPVNGIDGYIVLRRIEGSGLSVDDEYEEGLSKHSITLDSKLYKKSALKKTGWASYASALSPNTVSWIDKKASYGQMYEYCVIAYKKNSNTSNNYKGLPYITSYAKNRDISKPSSAEVGYRMKSPQFMYINKNSKTMTMQWSKVSGADGYIVECSTNSAFAGKKRKVVHGKSKTTAKFTGLSKSQNYCVRVRAYGNVFSGNQYSMWTESYFTNAQKRATMSRLMYKYKVKKEVKKKTPSSSSTVKAKTTSNLQTSKKAKKKVKYVTKTKPFELRARAGQKMGRYDTMQGGCSDGKYMYLILLNKIKKRCKIAKVSIKTKRVVKISQPLKLNHGNGLAYNPDTKRIVVTHAEGNRRAISEISKNSLRLVTTHYIYAPSTLPGATASQLRAYQGFGSIAYSSKEDVYVCLLYKSHNIVLLDENFRMIKYIPLSKKKGQIYQCVEVVGDSILIGESYGSTKAKSYNILSTYNWDGQYVTTTRLQKSFELENVFVAGTKVYAGFYRSYTKGRRFMKDNYVYRIKTF